jgi:hypothetical protein
MGYMGTDYRRVKENLKLRTYRNRYKNLKKYYYTDKTGLKLGQKKLSPEERSRLRHKILLESRLIKRKQIRNSIIGLVIGLLIAWIIFLA